MQTSGSNELSQWTALTARISLFLPLEEQATQRSSVLEIYQKLWGTAPDGYQSAPAPNFPSHAQGQRNGLTVNCATAPNRLDIIFSPKQTPQPSGTLDVIVDASSLYEELTATVSKLSTESPSERCIGFSLFMHFVSPEHNTVSNANAAISAVIPESYRPILSTEENFLLQINSPYITSEKRELKINLIKKWGVEQFRIVRFSVQQGSPAPLVPEVKNLLAPTVSFEVNNMPMDSNVHFSKSDQSALILEGLLKMAVLQRDLGLKIEGFNDAI